MFGIPRCAHRPGLFPSPDAPEEGAPVRAYDEEYDEPTPAPEEQSPQPLEQTEEGPSLDPQDTLEDRRRTVNRLLCYLQHGKLTSNQLLAILQPRDWSGTPEELELLTQTGQQQTALICYLLPHPDPYRLSEAILQLAGCPTLLNRLQARVRSLKHGQLKMISHTRFRSQTRLALDPEVWEPVPGQLNTYQRVE